MVGANRAIELEKALHFKNFEDRPSWPDRTASQPINMSKGVMDTSLERIHAKIAELETRIADLRIAERELLTLDKGPARQARAASEPKAKAKPKQKPGPKAAVQTKRRGKLKATEPAEARQTIGAAIAEVLGAHGALSAADLAERIKATGRDVTNRTVSFALQALKKRGLAKNTNGKWTAPKARSRNARPSPEAAAPKAPEAEKAA
jgi:ribosomal protein L9